MIYDPNLFESSCAEKPCKLLSSIRHMKGKIEVFTALKILQNGADIKKGIKKLIP